MIAVQDAVEIAGPEVDTHQAARDIVGWALAVAGAQQAERIVQLRVRVGGQPRLNVEDLQFTIQLLTRSTIAEGAKVEVCSSSKPGIVVERVTIR